MSAFKTVCRTLFYQFFVLFVGVSIGFIANAEWCGWKSNLVSQSFMNIFFPTEFTEDVCDKIKNWGAFKIWGLQGYPDGFEIIEDGLLAEEFYIAKVKFINDDGKLVEEIISTRVRWKTWEYYWTNPEPWSEADVIDYIENGTLNSHESDKAFKLLQESNLNKS